MSDNIQISSFTDGTSELERASRPVAFNSESQQVRISTGRGLEVNSILLHEI